MAKKMKFYVIDAYKVARDTGMGSRINTIMQTCFFAISGVLPREEAIDKIKYAIKKTYGKKGEEVVQKNYAAVDQTLANLHEVKVPAKVTSHAALPAAVPAAAPEFVQKVTAMMMAGLGDDLPVSAMPVDGTYPTGTTKWEKRNISQTVPVWLPEVCTQCGMCSMVCPHSVIRAKTYPESALAGAPAGFKSAPLKGKEVAPGSRYTLHGFVEDCTGCGLCVGVCPAKSKEQAGLRAINMQDKAPIQAQENAQRVFFEAREGRTGGRARPDHGQGPAVPGAATSSSRARAPAAARRPTSSSSARCSATACWWPTPPAAPPSTAATCPPRRGRTNARGAGRPGPTPCSRTTPSSASATA
jgi:pyruvate-ferredoxin/flavodoxin oxidoreductase